MKLWCAFFQRLYDDTRGRKFQIETLNRFGGKFLKEVKVSVTLFAIYIVYEHTDVAQLSSFHHKKLCFDCKYYKMP